MHFVRPVTISPKAHPRGLLAHVEEALQAAEREGPSKGRGKRQAEQAEGGQQQSCRGVMTTRETKRQAGKVPIDTAASPKTWRGAGYWNHLPPPVNSLCTISSAAENLCPQKKTKTISNHLFVWPS